MRAFCPLAAVVMLAVRPWQFYETFDIYEEVRRHVDAALSEKGRKRLPGVPQRGRLDLRQIIGAGYAFA